MFHIEDVLQMKDGEDIKQLIRRHPLTLVTRLTLSFLLIVVPFFFLFPLFSLGLVGMILFFMIVLGGVVFAFRTFIMWDSDVLILTTLRVVEVDQRGVFSRFVTEVALPSIQDVTWSRHGVWATLFRMGNVEIQTGGATPRILVTNVSKPDMIHELINDLRHATVPKRTHLSPERQERLRKLTKLMEELSDEALDRLESGIKKEGQDIAVGNFLKKQL